MIRKTTLLIGLLVSLTSITFSCSQVKDNQQIENLRAFAKLYGYIKYFHPSDEASNIDWDKFAVYGVSKIKDVRTTEELKNTLSELFNPIAPTLQIYEKGEVPVELVIPKDVDSFKQVTWQHLGVELSKRSNMYKSIRTNRITEQKHKRRYTGFGTITKGIDAKLYHNRIIRLSAAVRTEVSGIGNQGQLWLRVDMPDTTVGFFDNMVDRPITGSAWKNYEIVGSVPEGARWIVFGCFLKGVGKTFVDNLKVEYQDTSKNWIPINIENSDFEYGNVIGVPFQWGGGSVGYKYSLVSENVFNGTKCLLIESTTEDSDHSKKLYERLPEDNEFITRNISENLLCNIRLSLLSDSIHTLPYANKEVFERLTKKLALIDLSEESSKNHSVNISDIIISWNVFQHFYPYFDVLDIDWNDVLVDALSETLRLTGKDSHYDILRKMVAKLEDGHGVVYEKSRAPKGGIPIKVEYREKSFVVVASKDSVFLPGDLILSVDGKSSEEYLKGIEQFVSGSSQLKTYRALNLFGDGVLDSFARIKIQRGDERIDIKYKRKEKYSNLFFNSVNEFSFPDIKRLPNNIYYVNLHTTPNNVFMDSMQVLRNAKGVIFDCRYDGERKGKFEQINNRTLISNITNKTVESAQWHVPEVIYPDQEELSFYESSWSIDSSGDSFKGKVVFIIQPSVVSSGETYMGIVENYKLAEFVGSTTAGCNGNANFIFLPGGYTIMWTGMKVLKHDGSQHHLIGIEPTYPVEKTIQAVKEGRDEYLEKAIEVIMNLN